MYLVDIEHVCKKKKNMFPADDVAAKSNEVCSCR